MARGALSSPRYINGPDSEVAPTPLDRLIAFAANSQTNAIPVTGASVNNDGITLQAPDLWFRQSANSLCNLDNGADSRTSCLDNRMGRVIYARIRFAQSGTYALQAAHDDHVQVDLSSTYNPGPAYRTVNWNLPVGRLSSYTAGETTFREIGTVISPDPQSCALIRVHWNNVGGKNFMRLRWRPPGAATYEDIPASDLFNPSVAPAPGECAQALQPASPAITVVKEVAGRADPNDQFTVQVARSANGGSEVGHVTTSGQVTRVSTTLPLDYNANHYLRDLMAGTGAVVNSAAYTASATCTRTRAGVATPVTLVSEGAGVWRFGTATAANGPIDRYNCTITNTPVSYPVRATAGPGGVASCTPTAVYYGAAASCTATPAPGYAFAGWTGACAGQGPTCSLSNITSERNAHASFAPLPGTLTVTKTVAGAPAGGAPGPYDFAVTCAGLPGVVSGRITLAVGETTGQATVPLPAGAGGCTLTETLPPPPANYSWGRRCTPNR